MKLLAGAVLAGQLAAHSLLAQQTTPTTLAPPSVKWGGGNWIVPSPGQLVGYDDVSGLPCIVGSSATCQLSVLSSSRSYTDLGPCQLTVTNAAIGFASCLTPGSGGIPSGATIATITVEGNPIRWAGTGSTNPPTQGFGNLVAIGAPFNYSGPLANFRMNDTAAGTATVDVEFFK